MTKQAMLLFCLFCLGGIAADYSCDGCAYEYHLDPGYWYYTYYYNGLVYGRSNSFSTVGQCEQALEADQVCRSAAAPTPGEWEDVSTQSDGATPASCGAGAQCAYKHIGTGIEWSALFGPGSDHKAGSFEEASQFCSSLAWAGYSDWKLPSIDVFNKTVKNEDGGNDLLKIAQSPFGVGGFLWTADPSGNSRHLTFHEQTFQIESVLDKAKLYMRCVRFDQVASPAINLSDGQYSVSASDYQCPGVAGWENVPIVISRAHASASKLTVTIFSKDWLCPRNGGGYNCPAPNKFIITPIDERSFTYSTQWAGFPCTAHYVHS